VHLYWTVSNIYSLGQVLLFKIPFVKRICNLPDDPSKPVPVEQLRPKVVYANRPPKGAAAEAKPANPARVKP
jgi:membrane protein insertase Oxa1/YidC/SpoIIIJ